ncbi:BTB/POZ domain-containing protein kctd14 [Balamuthia mandrillaris]
MEKLHNVFGTGSSSAKNVVKLNVGGQLFLTTLDTLQSDKDSELAALTDPSNSNRVMVDGAIFVDRDGTHFRHILNFLRSGVLNIHSDLILHNELLVEADFYQLQSLKDLLQATLPKADPEAELRKCKERVLELEQEVAELRKRLEG